MQRTDPAAMGKTYMRKQFLIHQLMVPGSNANGNGLYATKNTVNSTTTACCSWLYRRKNRLKTHNKRV